MIITLSQHVVHKKQRHNIMNIYYTATESERIHKEFEVDVVTFRLLHEVNQFDISITDKITALKNVIAILAREVLKIN